MKKTLQFFAKAALALMAFIGLANSTNAQCIAGEVEVFIDVTTDTWGYENYWELVPTGQACGGVTIFTGGNTAVGCAGGGAQVATPAGPGAYPNTTTITEPQTPTGFCLTIGNTYDIITVDDWGDGGTTYESLGQGFTFVQASVANETFTFTAQAAVAEDIQALSESGEYTRIPLSQVVSMPLDADVRNNGTVAVSDAIVTANVYISPNFVTPVQTGASPATAIASGATTALSAGSYLPTIPGDYLVEYIVSATSITDADPTNDTLFYQFSVGSDGMYARDNGQVTVQLGVNAPSSGILGNIFDINVTGYQMDSVYFFAKVTINDSAQIFVYDVVAGVPTTQIGKTADYLYTAADTNGNITLPVTNMTGGPLTLTPGKYFVGIWDSYTGFLSLGFTSGIYTPGGSMGNINNGVFADMGALGFPQAAVVRPFINLSTGIEEMNSKNVSIYPNPSTGLFTINNNNGTINYTVTTVEGKVVRQLSNVSGSTISIDLSNENNGIYFLTINGENTNNVFKIVKQ